MKSLMLKGEQSVDVKGRTKCD